MPQLAPGFIGELGRGLPYQTGQQQIAVDSDISDMAGTGNRRRRANMLALDARNNISPSAQAGTMLSQPQPTPQPEGGAPLLPTDNVNGMATPPTRPRVVGNNAPPPVIPQPMPAAPQSSPSQTVQDMRAYQQRLQGLPDPKTVAHAGVEKRGIGTKILDTLQGVGQGLQQGGILGAIGGGVGGFSGKLREQALAQKQQAENQQTRAEIMQQFGISKAIGEQEDQEANRAIEGRKIDYNNKDLGFKQGKEAFDQKIDQAKFDLDQKIRTGQLTVDQAKVQLDNVKNQLMAEENALRAQETYRGQPLPGGFADRLGQQPGYVLPNKEKDQGHNWQEITDENGNVSLYDRNSANPNEGRVNTGIVGKKPNQGETKEAEIQSIAAERALKDWTAKNPGGGRVVANPEYEIYKQKAAMNPGGDEELMLLQGKIPQYTTFNYKQDPEYQRILQQYANEARTSKPRTSTSSSSNSSTSTSGRTSKKVNSEAQAQIERYKKADPNSPQGKRMGDILRKKGYID